LLDFGDLSLDLFIATAIAPEMRNNSGCAQHTTQKSRAAIAFGVDEKNPIRFYGPSRIGTDPHNLSMSLALGPIVTHFSNICKKRPSGLRLHPNPWLDDCRQLW